jgi:large repetitive protein
VNDTPAAVNGRAGGTIATVIGNDTLNGAAVALAAINLTPSTAPTPTAGSIAMTASGTIAVAAGSTPGTYSYPYTICERLNPANCDTATATVVVSPPVIDAVNDTPVAANGRVSGTVPTVLVNDTLGGVPATTATVGITPGTAPTPDAGSITMNPATGTIAIAPGTTAGSYPYTYQICQVGVLTNCDTATVTVVVSASQIDAVNDAPVAINGASGGSTPTVLGNYTLNGAAVVLADINLTPGTAPTPVAGSITMNGSGIITVAPGTTAGTYHYTYRICERLNPANCDTATATATVTVAAPPIDAVNDAPAVVNGFTGGATASVLGNDTLNSAPATIANVRLTPGLAPTPTVGSISMNADGTISIAAGTTAGTYSYPYTICDRVNLTSCDTATATVVVAPPSIVADDDSFAATPVNSFTGGNAGSVLTNDRVNGAAIDPALTTITVVSVGGLTGATINDAGTFTVAAGTPAGTYNIQYRLCQDLNPTNCDTAIATVVVAPPAIVADDDDFAATSVNGRLGGPDGSVLTNDRLNRAIVNPARTTITVLDPDGLTGVTISDAGVLSVPAGTPAGTYSVEYRLCEDLNAGNCDNAIAIATVVVAPAVIDAIDDTLPSVPGLTGGTTTSVLTNDRLNGAPVVPSEIALTPGTILSPPAVGSITMNPNGTITIAPGTSAGSYSYPYTICEVLNPLNCNSAIATVVVGQPDVDARPEPVPTLPGATPPSGTIMNELASDVIGGQPATTSNVTITLISVETDEGTPYPEIVQDTATGNVTMTGPSFGAVVQVTYRICDIANPTNCDTQTESIGVTPLVLEALPEAFDPITGLTGGTLTIGDATATIINSDIVDDLPATLSGVGAPAATDIVIPAPVAGDYTDLAAGLPTPYFALNPAIGVITVAANTRAGSYGIFYEICDPLNLSNCDGITETVTVLAATIAALNDTPPPITGLAGGDTPSVLGNDTLNGVPVTLTTVTLAPGTAPSPSTGSITMNPDGTITVATGTTSGTYVYPYEICEMLNPTNCATAEATMSSKPRRL